MKKATLFFAALFAAFALYAGNEHTLHVITTGDVHGAWFDGMYSEKGTRNSLFAVKNLVDGIRGAVGSDNVLLLDAGDCLQGDNAPYYYNYVAKKEPHLYPLLVKYMGYDAVTVGNHDIETGHPVYDRVRAELGKEGIPWLAGNAVKADGAPYFQEYKVFKRAGLKVLVLGYTNANIKAWLKEELWKGLDFKSLEGFVQKRVDAVKDKEKPQVTIVMIHSGTGKGDGKELENQGLDLFGSLKGVDLLVGAHDHRQMVKEKPGFAYVNGGARAAAVGHAVLTVQTKGSKVVSKSVTVETVKVNRNKIDKEMKAHFLPWYKAVEKFSLRKIGELKLPLATRDAYRGMCPYIDFIHSVQLLASKAQISFAAPLTFNGFIPCGTLIYSDLFKIYPFENALQVLRMKGSEIKAYLEYSYDGWIVTSGEHLLKIVPKSDERTGAKGWSFVGRPYNFDSAAGLDYTVDITAPKGSRVKISALADGTAFDENAYYTVALSSYRASGGGGLLPKGAGLDVRAVEERTTGVYPEVRELIADYIATHPVLDGSTLRAPALLGNWKFVPEKKAAELLDADMKLLFPEPKR